jgi:hypothetical protein
VRGRPLKILFVLLHPGYVRNYESTIRLLLERGHRIHLAFSQPGKQSSDQLAERLDAEFEGLTFGRAPKREGGGWRKVTWTVRSLMDFARYLHPRYSEAPLLQQRVANKIAIKSAELGRATGFFAVGFVRLFGEMRSAQLSAFWIAFLRGVEEAVPPSRSIDRFTLSHEPDLVLLTPVVNIGSNEVEYVKSARRLGIPCGLCVASWDNLSNKGLVRIEPDRVFVWNATQLREAVEMHGIPAEKVVVTGAQRFDEWFEMKVTRTREEFSIAAGLEAGRPFLLYLCSSPFIAPEETGFVERWIRAIRAAKDLAPFGVLIRPHPQNVAQWQDADFSHLGNVSIWPRAGAQPIDADSKNDFFESTSFSTAVAGVNTSALIEAAILGKSVFTVLAPEFEGTQRGTLHFHYLLHENGGFLHVASSMGAHIAQLREALRDVDTRAEQTKRFIGSFIRPLGTDVPATPVLADAIEKLGGLTPTPLRRSPAATAMAIPLRGLVMSARAGRAAKRALRAAPARARPQTMLRGPLARVGVADRRAIALLRAPAAQMLRFAGRHDRLREFIRALFGDELAQARLESLSRAKGRIAEDDAAHLASREVRRLRKSRAAAIVVGPWLGDPLHELLYWIPFVRHQARKHGLEPSRMIVLSRGGVRGWYRGLGGDHVSVEDHLAEEDLATLARRWHDAFAHNDRATLTLVDRAVMRACGGLDSDGHAAWTASVLAPALASFRRGGSPLRLATGQLDFAGLKPAENRQVEQRLPTEFVAVAAPEGASSETLLRAYRAVASRLPLVAADTEADWPSGIETEEIRFPLDDVRLSRSLAAQSVVVGRAAAYVGPWGHLPVMAVAHGVQAVALVARDRPPNAVDVDLTYRLAWKLDVPLHVLDLEQLETAAAVADAVAMAPFGQRRA